MRSSSHPVLLVVLLASPASWAGVDETVAAVEARYAKVTALEATFTQTTHSALYGDEQQTGTIALKRPNKVRWHSAGDGRLFVTDGETMWIYTPADKQVIRYRGFNPSASAAMAVLNSLDRLGQVFEVQAGEGEGTVLVLKPRNDESVKNIQLTLDAELQLEQVVITDPFDSVTDLAFSSVTLNATVPDALFSFEIPAGVEVVDAGGP